MTEIEEITWETFDERTRIWMQVLANIPTEAVVRMLRLDLNTGFATLHGVGGDKALGLPLVWDDVDGLCWITDNLDEVFDDGGNTTDLREYRDAVRRFAAWCWVGDFATDMDDDIPLQVTKESTPNMIRYLTGGHGSVEIAVAPDDEGLIDVNILDPQGRGLSFHLAYGTPDVKEAHDRAVLFLNNLIEKNERKEIRSEN